MRKHRSPLHRVAREEGITWAWIVLILVIYGGVKWLL